MQVKLEQIYMKCESNRNIKNCQQANRYLVFNGETFEYRMKDDVQDEMIEQSHVLLNDHYEQHSDRFKREMSFSLLDDVERYLESLNSKDMAILLKLRDSIDNTFQRLAAQVQT